MLTNLIKNSFIHSTAGGTVDISLTRSELKISNNGNEALDATRLFDRFYTSGKSGSTGLGLALVKSIAAYYNFGLEYTFQENKHSFTIRLRQ
jgi:signal transduction histidine kinase